MQTKNAVKSSDNNESEAEAKHPGVLLGLIMGIYPAILIGGLLIAIATLGFRSTFLSTSPKAKAIETEESLQTSGSTEHEKKLEIQP